MDLAGLELLTQLGHKGCRAADVTRPIDVISGINCYGSLDAFTEHPPRLTASSLEIWTDFEGDRDRRLGRVLAA